MCPNELHFRASSSPIWQFGTCASFTSFDISSRPPSFGAIHKWRSQNSEICCCIPNPLFLHLCWFTLLNTLATSSLRTSFVNGPFLPTFQGGRASVHGASPLLQGSRDAPPIRRGKKEREKTRRRHSNLSSRCPTRRTTDDWRMVLNLRCEWCERCELRVQKRVDLSFYFCNSPLMPISHMPHCPFYHYLTNCSTGSEALKWLCFFSPIPFQAQYSPNINHQAEAVILEVVSI